MPRRDSDLVRDTKVPAQNIISLVVSTGLFSRENKFGDHVGRIDLVKLCIKLMVYNGKYASYARVMILASRGID